jgi:hypothetical protein
MARDTIFISHATPDDNDFVRWLGARLTGHGFKVWADLFELKGGTPFWSTIEEALKHHAIKVIFVVSQSSVDPNRGGVRNELSVADSLKKVLKDSDFIIPVRIDDTPFSDLPIQIHQLNTIDFSRGWGAKLIELLDTLDTANVPKFHDDRREDFEAWRRSMIRTAATVEVSPERIVSNWVPIKRLPSFVNFFESDGSEDVLFDALKAAGIPYRPFYRLAISLTDFAAVQDAVPTAINPKARARVSLEDFLAGKAEGVTAPLRDDARNFVTYLLRAQIEAYLGKRGLKRHDTSSGETFYFPSGLVPNNKVTYVAASGRKTNKNVVGRSERNLVNWHLAMKVNVVLGQTPFVRFKPYICFSEDGQKAISDPKRTSAIRCRFCKNWWNKQWRQLQQAFCAFLSDGNAEIVIAFGDNQLVLEASLLELVAARRMPDDLTLADEIEDDADDPTEVEDPDADIDHIIEPDAEAAE